MSETDNKERYDASRKKFLSLSLESTRKSYYPQLKKHLDAAKENERRLQLLLDNMPARISYVNTEKRYVSVNQAYEKAFGLERKNIIGQHVRTVLGNTNYQNVADHMDTALSGKHDHFESVFTVAEGEQQHVDINYVPDITPQGEVTGFYVLTLDVTEKKRAENERATLEKRLVQAQKMESLGTLAGGIAHDFNNILSPLLGFAELLKLEIPKDSPLFSYVEGILDAAMRSREMVKQILTFSRQAEKEILPIRLQPILKEALRLLRSSIPTTIEFQTDIDPKCGIVMADPTQIHQVIMNLATNAYHAMENTGGHLSVTLHAIEINPNPITLGDLAPGQYARIRVCDTGCGIKKEILDKVFDPYFTTKEKNKGTGLGLSVVQGIVKSFQGDIRIHSEPGKGTEVRVYLPISKQHAVSSAGDIDKPVPEGHEHLLLVDDEKAILTVEEKMLSKLGYKVTAIGGSQEALKTFSEDPGKFDLVLTDMTMPSMTGIALSREMKKIRPDIPILLCSGFSDQINQENIQRLGIEGYIMKPVIRRDLAKAIRNALDIKKTG